MAKIERKYLAHFINTAGNGTAVYERLGKDLEEFRPKLAAQVNTKKNILGETTVLISGYEKTARVEPYYAEANSALFERLQDIIENDRVMDALKTDVVEVKLWEPAENNVYPAIREEAYIEIVNYGGDTTGYQISFVLHFIGNKVKGTFHVTDKTFTADV